ncbi:hypothetical protein OIU84_002768, partial [Salix udensis]
MSDEEKKKRSCCRSPPPRRPPSTTAPTPIWYLSRRCQLSTASSTPCHRLPSA